MRVFMGPGEQEAHYARIVAERRPTQAFVSCGYYERFDPLLLDRKPFLEPVYERLFAKLFPAAPARLLDVGCGTALYWPVLRRRCASLVGIDPSAAMIEEASRLVEAKRLDGVALFVGGLGDADLAEGSFDAALCVDVLHHLADLRGAVRALHRLLAPGGRLCAVEPNAFNPAVWLAHAIPREERRAVARSYAPRLRRLFAPYFADIRVEYVNYVASAASAASIRRWAAVDRLMGCSPWLRWLSLRQILTMRRRP